MKFRGSLFVLSISLTVLAHELYETMEQNGMGPDDNSGMIQILEMMAGKEEYRAEEVEVLETERATVLVFP